MKLKLKTVVDFVFLSMAAASGWIAATAIMHSQAVDHNRITMADDALYRAFVAHAAERIGLKCSLESMTPDSLSACKLDQVRILRESMSDYWGYSDGDRRLVAIGVRQALN